MGRCGLVLAVLAGGLVACGGSTQPVGTQDVIEVAEVAEVAAELPSDAEIEVALLVAPPGCPEYLSQPTGDIREVKLAPDKTTLDVPLGDVKTLTFAVTIIYKDGHTFQPPAGEFVLSNPGVGTILNTGDFSSIQNTGGETYVTFSIAGVCGSAYLRVVQTWQDLGDSQLADPAAIVAGTLAPTVSGDMEMAYPPDGALSPSDFPAITVQVRAPSMPTYGIVRFEASAARFDYLFSTKAAEKTGGYAVTLSAGFWANLFQINGADSYAVSVIGFEVNNGAASGQVWSSDARTFWVTRQAAGGAFYYWNTAVGSIRYLELGKEKSKGIPLPTGGCVGCHSISPDADIIGVSPFMGSGGMMNTFNLVLADPVTGKEPSWIHADAKTQFQNSYTIAPAFSKTYWTETDKRIVVPSTNGGFAGTPSLYNIDLITGKVAKLVKSGDSGGPAFPAWSPSGADVVYTSATNPSGPTSFAISGASRLFHVPYNDGQGGVAAALAGADEPGVLQYYPAFSPDGLWIAYNKAVEQLGPACAVIAGSGTTPGSGGTYDNCKAEVFIVPASGGPSVRLDKANGLDSPGVGNSWPTFGVTAGKYYWIAFASRRDYGIVHTGTSGNPAAPQIWIAAVEGGRLMQGVDGSFAALWLPFQEMESGNHIARWGLPPRSAAQ